MLKKIFLFIVLLNLSLLASSLEEDIALLKSTPKDKRYILMNKIKLRLSKMNAHQRAVALKNLLKAVKTNKEHPIHTLPKLQKNHQAKEMMRVKTTQDHFEKKGGKTISHKEKTANRHNRHRGNH